MEAQPASASALIAVKATLRITAQSSLAPTPPAELRQRHEQYLNGHEITEGLLNHIEVAIRAFDPCLSCATHALGKMPLEVEVLDETGERLSFLARSGNGVLT